MTPGPRSDLDFDRSAVEDRGCPELHNRHCASDCGCCDYQTSARNAGAELMPGLEAKSDGTMILLRGYGQVYNTNAGRADCGEGFLLSDDQFADMISTLPGRLRDNCEAKFRAEVEWLREVFIQAERQREQQVTRARSHQALGRIVQHVGHLLACAEQLDFDWLTQHAPTEAARGLGVFYLFPGRLRALSESARRKARQGDNAQLLSLADAADHLADELVLLDQASEDNIHRELPDNDDYDVHHLADAIRIAQRLELAARTALEKSKKKAARFRVRRGGRW
ncbi:hypothetical protein AB8Z38_34880 [Bradyrhizobium sp. LLZ17]|uniref:Uncharacterized protein n=1 Tax=Bradyrhizobium sp. LLZ17 TaxID=3239388 RepID=A0AB39XKG6_9BRAD